LFDYPLFPLQPEVAYNLAQRDTPRAKTQRLRRGSSAEELAVAESSRFSSSPLLALSRSIRERDATSQGSFGSSFLLHDGASPPAFSWTRREFYKSVRALVSRKNFRHRPTRASGIVS